MKFFLTIASFITSTIAQSVTISAPLNGSTLASSSSIIIEVNQAVSAVSACILSGLVDLFVCLLDTISFIAYLIGRTSDR